MHKFKNPAFSSLGFKYNPSIEIYKTSNEEKSGVKKHQTTPLGS
jgi:hypothetical protein